MESLPLFRTGLGVRYQAIRLLSNPQALSWVYLATGPEGVKVVVKDLSNMPEGVLSQAEQEANILHRVRSPYFPQLTHHEPRRFLILEYFPGMSLDHLLDCHGPFGWDVVYEVTRQLLEALCHLHQQNIVHRDVKPGNVMLLQGLDLRVRLIDFGISFWNPEIKPMAGAYLGTLGYMAPERWEDCYQPVPNCDIYGVGLVAYELLVGKELIGGDDLWKVGSPEPHDLSALQQCCPGGLVSFIDLCLRKEPGERPKDARSALTLLAAGLTLCS